MQARAQQHGLDWQVDSAGTGNWHVGQPPDQRSIAVAKDNGVDISKQRARQFSSQDFDHFDHIFVMDSQNLRDVLRHAKAPNHRQKVRLLLDVLWPDEGAEVPDPYYGEASDFQEVFDMVDEASLAFITYQLATAKGE